MKIQKYKNPSDEQIRQAIRQALPPETGISYREASTKQDVKAIVGEGYVILQGVVESHYERHAVESAVRPILGVRGVLNKILVQPGKSSVAHKVLVEESLACRH